jgi:hypothetical protein
MLGIGAKILEFITGKVAENGAGLVKEITGLVDESKYSEEEKALMGLKITDAVNKYNMDILSETTKQVLSEDQAITDRWKADMESDSWLSKNTRPLVMLSLIGFLFLMIIFDSAIKEGFEVKDAYLQIVQYAIETVVVAYYGSRGVEKFKSMHETTKQKTLAK